MTSSHQRQPIRSAGRAPRSRAHFAAHPSSVRLARRHVREVLAPAVGRDDLTTAELLVSELATNAVVHARSPFAIAVGVHPGRLRIEVCDRTLALPTVRDASPSERSGRGMRIVSSLADRWGADVTPSGKSVWFELDR